MSRAVLRRFGERPYTITVYVEERRGRRLVCAHGTVRGRTRRLRPSLPDSPANRQEMLTYARDYAAERRTMARDQRRQAEQGPTTLRQLWERYRSIESAHWRSKTRTGYEGYWRIIADYFDADRAIPDLTLDHVDAFRVRRRRDGIAHAQIRRQIGFLRQLLNFAEARGLLVANRLRAYRYRIPKDERRALPAEYSRDELLRIATELGPGRVRCDGHRLPDDWRARVIVKLCGSTGKRIHAVLHLRWDDVDEAAAVIRWPAVTDKNGREHVQPLTLLAAAALAEARRYERQDQPWVFWPAQERTRARGVPYHYNSVHHQLRQAEVRAGVTHLEGRAFHGLRKMIEGDIRRRAGLPAAAAWLNDTSLRVVEEHYDKQRVEDIEAARAAVEQSEAVA